MTNAAVDVALHLRLKDQATPGLDKAAQRAVENERKGAEASEQAQRRMRTSYQATSQAREVLGVRSEQRIQREIAVTESAYKRLMATGKLSATEQARALDATRAKVTALTNEMGKLTREQERAAKAGWAVQAGVGVLAAGAVVTPSVKRAMAFDERLGLMANTAYAEYDSAGRKVGERQMKAAIALAVKEGITRDGASDALDKLIKDNQVGGVKGAMELLPYIGKVSTGSGSDPTSVAAMMGSLIGSGYAKNVDEAKRMMGIATAAAGAGAFEKEDMAKHLPALLPLAAARGLTGEAGLVKVLTLLQQARTTAGSSDEAAINTKNLLTKLDSTDTAGDFKKAGRGDLAKYLLDQRAQGVDALTAWQNVIALEVKRNPNLQPAMDKLQAAKNPQEREAALEALNSMAAGQSIAKYFQDMQAQSAVFGMQNKEMEAAVLEAVRMRAGTAVELDAQHMMDKASTKARIAAESGKMGEDKALEGTLSGIGAVADRLSQLSQAYPEATGTVTLMGKAAFAAAGAIGLLALTSGGRAGIAGVTAGMPKGATLLEKGKKYGVRVGAPAALALGANVVLDKVTDDGSVINRYGKSASEFAMLGALAGPWGAAAGAAMGIALQGWKDMQGKKDDAPTKPEPTETKVSLQLGLPPGMVVQQQSTQTLGSGTFGMSVGGTGNIMTGAPQ